MATVAEQLRQAREEQKLNVYQVAEITKIKTDHIRALESGTYDSFSAPVYIRGFVRTYAKALKLDLAKVTADLESELSKTEKFCEPPPLTPKKGGALDFLMLQLSKLNLRLVAIGAGVAIVVLLIALGLRACGNRPKSDPLKNLGPGLHRTKPGDSGEKLPLPAPPPPRKS
jgi:cytoskeletal protein RodZ